MASFDFIEAAAKGYEFSWYERSYFVRAAVPVVLVKLACIFLIQILNIQDKILLSGLVMMPAHVLEALLMVSVVRFIAFREPLFEFKRVLGHKAQPESPCRGEAAIGKSDVKSSCNMTGVEMFKAGVAVYLLVKIVLLGSYGALKDYSQTIDPAVEVPVPEQNLANALVFMAITGAMLWALRLVWIYIPVAMGFTMRGFLKCAQGMMSSLNIFATWFVTFFPPLVLMYAVLMLFNFMFISETMLQVILQHIIVVFGDVLIVLVQTVALTFGFIEVLTVHQNKK